MKKFIICTAVFLGAILIMLTTTCFIKTQPKFTYDNPTSVVVYAKSSVAIKNGKGESMFSKDSITYREVTNLVNQMYKISMFSHISHGNSIKPVVGQDISESYSSWSSSILTKNYAVAFNFDEKQRQVVEYQGNTKVVEYFGFVIILNEEQQNYAELPIYFKTSTDGSYTKAPMLVKAKSKDLIKYIQSIK